MMWQLPQREGCCVTWSCMDYAEINVRDNWRLSSGSSGVVREGDKRLPSLTAKVVLEPGKRILCFGRYLQMDPKVPAILAKHGQSDNANPFQHLWDVSKEGGATTTLDGSPIIDPLVNGDQLVSGKGLFCWTNVQEPLVGHMPNVLFQVSKDWTRDPAFREVASWLRGPGNWAWFKMTESLATQLDREVRTDEVELLYMVVLEKIEVGEHIFGSRGRVVFPQLGVNRVVTLEQQLNRSPLCMSQRFIDAATRMMNATGFRGSLIERICQLFVDVGKVCDFEAVRTTLSTWEPRSRENRMMAITSHLLNSVLSSDVAAATPPSIVKVVRLWEHVPTPPTMPIVKDPIPEKGGFKGDISLDDADLDDFLAILGSDAKRKREDFKDGSEFDKVVKGILSGD